MNTGIRNCEHRTVPISMTCSSAMRKFVWACVPYLNDLDTVSLNLKKTFYIIITSVYVTATISVAEETTNPREIK
jgi:hypothetical protein